MAPVVVFNKLMVSAPFEIPSSGRQRRSANNVDLPAPLGPTKPIRSPRLTWSETSSKSARPAKDFESCETVSITESAQCCLVRCPAQLVNHESTRMNTNRRCSGGGVSRKLLTSADSSPVHSMRPDIEGCHPRTINPEYDAQIGFDHSSIDRVLGSRR